MFRIVESAEFGQKLLVRFIYRAKDGQEKEGKWNGLRLIPATTSCQCGYGFKKSDTPKLLSGCCPECGATQPKWHDSPVKSRGFFGGRDVITFRVANTSGSMIRTVCTPSILELRVK